MTQEDLAYAARVSTKHLSFVETGRAFPSRALVLALAEGLTIPSRERNALLLSAGFAPIFDTEPTDAAEPDFLHGVLRAHEPSPAIAVDRQWNLLAVNRIAELLLEGVLPDLLERPINFLRLALHPEGLAARIENLAEWRCRILNRLRRQRVEAGTPELDRLYAELIAYPGGLIPITQSVEAFVAPLRFNASVGRLALISTTMVFGTALGAEYPGLAVETFLPADIGTRRALQTLSETLGDAVRPFSAWAGSAAPALP
jgi:transcriptional regulator with XRE-family HTH domain